MAERNPPSFRLLGLLALACFSPALTGIEMPWTDRPPETTGMDQHTESPSLRAAAISRDGKHAVTGDGLGMIQVWDVPSGKLLHTIPVSSGHRKTLPSYAFSADAKLALVGHDGGLFLFGDPVQLG